MIDLGRRDGRMLRVGHRGAAALAAENTITSLALAVELGCDLVEAVRNGGLVERTVVSSFRPATLRALHALEPGLRLGLTYPEDRYSLGQRRLFAPLMGTTLAGLRAALPRRIGRMVRGAKASAAMLHWQVVSKPVVERCHSVGAPVLAWTLTSRDQVQALEELGVDGVIADDPRIFAG